MSLETAPHQTSLPHPLNILRFNKSSAPLASPCLTEESNSHFQLLATTGS